MPKEPMPPAKTAENRVRNDPKSGVCGQIVGFLDVGDDFIGLKQGIRRDRAE